MLEKIRPIVSNILQYNKIELVDITYRRESGGNVLRISADTESGITMDECARMNELISEALDKSDFIEDKYILEVSSPGLDRPLKSKSDFLRAKGKKIRIRTYAPLDTFDNHTSSGLLSITPSPSTLLGTVRGVVSPSNRKRSASRGENKKEFIGTVERADDKEVFVTIDKETTINIPFEKISSAKLVY